MKTIMTFQLWFICIYLAYMTMTVHLNVADHPPSLFCYTHTKNNT